MSSFLCFICHSTVNEEINEETREKYRDVVGMNLCPDSQLCYICCHVLNKLSLFRSICLKRSLEYPVLFSEKGTLNLQRSNIELHILCPDDCLQYQQPSCQTYNFTYSNSNDEITYNNDNKYVKLEENNDNFNSCQFINNENINYDFESNAIATINDDIENNDEFNLNVPESNINECTDVYDDTFNDTDNFVNDNDNAINDNCINEIDHTINETEVINNENNEIINENNDTLINNEHNDVINDTNETLNNEEIPKSDTKKAKVKSKSKKKCFKKIILSLEEQKAALEACRKEEKYTEAEFKCYNCAMGFLFKDTYQAHMMRHEESNGEYQCETCTLRFATATLLRTHTASHTERYICCKCGVSLKPRAKRLHMCVRKNVETVACQFCGNLFKDANGLQQHLKRVHGSKSGGRLLSCMVCGESYNSQAALRTHMIKHIKRKFHCDKCPAIYSSPYTLTQHKRTHESVGLHYCTTCGVGYASKKSLMAHKRNTMNHQQSLFECPICNRLCPNQRSLASHIQTVHSSTKDYTCTLCPARYTSRKSLVRHIGSHNKKNDVKMAICHLCGSSFKGNNKLNRHLREVCEKSKLEEEISALYY